MCVPCSPFGTDLIFVTNWLIEKKLIRREVGKQKILNKFIVNVTLNRFAFWLFM